MVDELRELLSQYYRNPSVRQRMTEFLGRPLLRDATAVYIVANDGYSEFCRPASSRCLPLYLSNGWDVERSLWDMESLIVDLDLDYEDFDSGSRRIFGWCIPAKIMGAMTTIFLRETAVSIGRSYSHT